MERVLEQPSLKIKILILVFLSVFNLSLLENAAFSAPKGADQSVLAKRMHGKVKRHKLMEEIKALEEKRSELMARGADAEEVSVVTSAIEEIREILTD